MIILKNLIYNIIILYSLSYILQVSLKPSKIILGAVVGSYKLLIPLLPDIIMFFIVFKKSIVKVRIITDFDDIMLTPFLDTGCTIEYFNKKVIILNEKLLSKYEIKYFVPYETINNTSVMPIIKIKKVIINNKQKNVLVGIIKMEEIELIMNPKILEE